MERQLNVTVKPKQEIYAPGAEAEVELTVTDQLGKPVEGELSLALVDEALLLLVPILLFSVVLFYIYNFKRCPNCKRRWALKTTGAERGGGWASRDPGSYEEKCQYCRYRQWVAHPRH